MINYFFFCNQVFLIKIFYLNLCVYTKTSRKRGNNNHGVHKIPAAATSVEMTPGCI